MNWNELKTNLESLVTEYGSSYKKRLLFEISEIEKQGAETYWTNLHLNNKKFEKNVNKLLIPYLLGMVSKPLIETTNKHSRIKSVA